MKWITDYARGKAQQKRNKNSEFIGYDASFRCMLCLLRNILRGWDHVIPFSFFKGRYRNPIDEILSNKDKKVDEFH